MTKELNQPVYAYFLTCEVKGVQYSYTVLAASSDNALSMINRDVGWDYISLIKIVPEIVGYASYCARDVSNTDIKTALNYQCKPSCEFWENPEGEYFTQYICRE